MGADAKQSEFLFGQMMLILKIKLPLPVALLFSALLIAGEALSASERVPEYINQQLRTRQYSTAITALESLASEHHVGALLRLGKLYRSGGVVQKDSHRAKRYLRQAADLGSVDAQYLLGVQLHYEATSIDTLNEAQYWFERAQAGGDKRATSALAKIRSEPVVGNIEDDSGDPELNSIAFDDRGVYLVSLAARGDQARLDAALRSGIPVNIRNRAGRNALSVAVENEDFALVNLLLSRGADVDLNGQAQFAPIMIAVKKELPELVRKLLRSGANPRIVDGLGNSPASYSVRAGNIEITRLLLNAGLDANSVDSNGSSLLDIAIAKGDQPMVELLNSHGGERNKAITEASQRLQIQLQNSNGLAEDDLLFRAIRQNNKDILKALVKNPDLVRSRNRDGLTPLALATILEDADAIETLVQNGAQVDTPDDLGLTPLHHAIRIDSEEMLAVLEDFRSRQNLAPVWRDNPLHFAIRLGRTNRAIQLLENRWDPHFKNASGDSAITLASRFGDLSILNWLQKQHRPLFDSPHELVAAIEAAIAAGESGVVHVLLNDELMPRLTPKAKESLLLEAALQGNPVFISELLARGASPDSRNDTGVTALMSASAAGCVSCIVQLLELGAEINLRDSQGNTALYFALMNGRQQVETVLLERGANPDIVNRAGESYASIIRKPAIER